MINNKIGGRNMVGRAVNRLAGRLTAVAVSYTHLDVYKRQMRGC